MLLLTDKELEKHGIVNYWSRTTEITHLFSETTSDPEIHALEDAPKLAVDGWGNALPYEIVTNINQGHNVTVTILVFKDELCKLKYKENHL